VVTYMLLVEAFATGSKWNQALKFFIRTDHGTKTNSNIK